MKKQGRGPSLDELKQAVRQSPGCDVELVYLDGASGESIPTRLRGRKRILRVKPYGFDLGIERNGWFFPSKLEIRNAKLCTYEPDSQLLKLFFPSPRPATDREQDILDAWEQRETATGRSYEDMRAFFAHHKALTLMSHRTHKKDAGTGRELVRDASHRGGIHAIYRVRGLQLF